MLLAMALLQNLNHINLLLHRYHKAGTLPSESIQILMLFANRNALGNNLFWEEYRLFLVFLVVISIPSVCPLILLNFCSFSSFVLLVPH